MYVNLMSNYRIVILSEKGPIRENSNISKILTTTIRYYLRKKNQVF